MEGEPQPHHRETWVPGAGRLRGPPAVPRGLAAPGSHPTFSRGKPDPGAALGSNSQGVDLGEGWPFILSRVGAAVNGVEGDCKMG